MARKKNETVEWIKAISIAVIIAAIIRFFFFTPIVVDGESMMPTLHDQNRMIVNKISYKIGGPDRFDVVVFHAPGGKDYIKRVIGLPGDHVEYKNDTLYINGKAYEEPYLDQYKSELDDGMPLTEDFKLEDTPGGDKVVPEGEIFVMGDNRRNSRDSRAIGPVSLKKVVGTTSIVYWPFNEIRTVD
ncbi:MULTISPECIES: signal peptidase I [Priestia]|jgi:signal peptidase I|uniref:Signal peptidase I n=3 Tax=Priestia TaxID=2800373 RepID=A0A0H4KNF0_9BACI|nr:MULTISPECIES: signal peptidase I [Priestia]AKO93859.1 signal peptidase I [Priestia filamentosa]KAB2494716.1 signal peptidase I [Priestia endophytica]KYG35785.1 S26 family signal peptidase [Priestia endophytica]MBG9814731.1 signal peptidase I [Priestia endophytica]MCM3539300.1 signal peptidase I [Priestia endophytica]